MLFDGLTIHTPPASEPLSLAEAKIFLRVDHSDENDLIESLIATARQVVEGWTHRALITQTVVVTWDRLRSGVWLEIPKPPLQSVTKIEAREKDGNYSDIATTYSVDTASLPGRVKFLDMPDYSTEYPAAIKMTYDAGYGDSATDVPNSLRQCVRFLVAHYYDLREPVTVGQAASRVPYSLQTILNAERVHSP